MLDQSHGRPSAPPHGYGPLHGVAEAMVAGGVPALREGRGESVARGRVDPGQHAPRGRLAPEVGSGASLTDDGVHAAELGAGHRRDDVQAAVDHVRAVHVVEGGKVGEGGGDVQREVTLQHAPASFALLGLHAEQAQVLLALLTDVTSNIRRKFSARAKSFHVI